MTRDNPLCFLRGDGVGGVEPVLHEQIPSINANQSGAMIQESCVLAMDI